MPLTAPTQLDDFASLMPWHAVAGERRVEFIEAPADLDFDLPFFHMTVESLTEANEAGELGTVSLSFDELRTIVGNCVPEPSGMIFHIGRCGSTLVSRMVGHDTGRFVLREAAPIGGLHRASAGSELVPTFTIEQAFNDVLVCFDRFAAARGQRVIVKHSSWESFSMGRVAEMLPTTPFVFVYRDPLATVESSLDGHPGWASRLHQPRAELQRWVPWLDRVEAPFNAASIYASVWAAGADAALRLPEDRVLFIDHAVLSSAPEQTLERLRDHLGLDLSIEQARNELGHYSKARHDGTAFDPQGVHAHPKLSPATQRQVLGIVGDLPHQLAARLAEQDC